MQSGEKILLELKHVSKNFSHDGGRVIQAVQDVSLTVFEGECLGIVGESGCGKSTLAKLITRMYPVTGGQLIFEGKDITHLGTRERREVYRSMQMVFQNPYSAFSPRMTIGTFLEEGLVYFKIKNRKEAKQEACRLLEQMGLPVEYYDCLPHQLSGGQLQRVVIARAISISPRLLILDEPTSALDVSVQSKILQLLVKLQKERKLTYLFIGHDLAVVQNISQRIIVMYSGRIVEVLKSDNLQKNAMHPYTKALLFAIISVQDRNKKKIKVQEMGMEDRGREEKGCLYRKHCPYAKEQCEKTQPTLKNISRDHSIACHLI